MSTRHSSSKAAQHPELRNAWLRPFESSTPGTGLSRDIPTGTFQASFRQPGQERAVALARAYLEYSRTRGDPRGADARAAQFVLERAQRGELTRPPTRTPEGSRYQVERDLQYNVRVTRAWLYGPAFMGDHEADTSRYDPAEREAANRERTQLVKGAHVSGPEGSYDLYTPAGLPVLPTTAERDRAAAHADVTRWERQLDTIQAQKAREAAQQQRPNESTSRRAASHPRRLAG